MEESIAKLPKDYYLRDCDIELTLKNIDVLLRKRNEIFNFRRKTNIQSEKEQCDEISQYYTDKIKELLKLCT